MGNVRVHKIFGKAREKKSAKSVEYTTGFTTKSVLICSSAAPFMGVFL